MKGKTLIYCKGGGRPRAVLLLDQSVTATPLTGFLSPDLAAAIIRIDTLTGRKEVIIASSYFPYEEEKPPPKEVAHLVEFSKRRGLQLVMGCDANSHHMIWGSSDTRSRGEHLLDFITKNDLAIVNRGTVPTYRHEGLDREEVLDLTLTSLDMEPLMKDWHVSSEPSLSDHRYIEFNITATTPKAEAYRDPRRTDWDRYVYGLKERLVELDMDIESNLDLEEYDRRILEAIVKSYNDACPIIVPASKRCRWWSRRLEAMKADVRRLYKDRRSAEGRAEYSKALTAYNSEIRRAKRADFRRYTEEIEDLPAAARLKRALGKDHSNGIGMLRRTDGTRTESETEALEVLMSAHFPRSIPSDDTNFDSVREIPVRRSNRRLFLKSKKIISERKVKWAIDSLKPYKSPGPDGIRAILLQRGLEVLLPYLVRLYRWSYALSYLPTDWTRVRVIFIPKSGKRDEEDPKSYRPISLTSVILKTMEKLIDLHIKTKFLSHTPLNRSQYAYQAGKSTVSALHRVVRFAEKQIKYRQIGLAAFIDVEGAFDNAGFNSIKNSAKGRGFEAGTVKWMSMMLQSRRISAHMGDRSMTVRATRGCPQGGVLSPLMWSLVIDGLLEELQRHGYEVVGYADDLVILVGGNDEEQISKRLQLALNIAYNWCKAQGLGINPAKTTLVPFTKKRTHKVKMPSLGGATVGFSSEVKYLGIFLDSKMSWSTHLEHVKTKATKALMSCRGFVARTWGLRPRIMHWVYTAIVRPMLTYGSFVWWPKVTSRAMIRTLSKLQRLAIFTITGCRRSSPTVALEAMLDLPPLHIFILKEAALAAYRLLEEIDPKPGDFKGHLQIYEKFPNLVGHRDVSDQMPIRFEFEMNFEVIFPERNDWQNRRIFPGKNAMYFFTDGSYKDGRTGAGVFGPGLVASFPMGSMATIFQAEIYAIKTCAQECLERQELSKRHIVIASDSQAALKALTSSTFKSKLVFECRQVLNNLGKKSRLSLLWVPGHSGVAGNERADDLAKQGAETAFIGPEPFCGFNVEYQKKLLDKWEATAKVDNFATLSIESQSRHLVKIDKRRTEEILLLSKPDLRLAVAILTGHCELNAHLVRIGRIRRTDDDDDDVLCRFCKEEDETSLHILCECAALAGTRMKSTSFGKGFPSPQDINQTDLQRILHFFKMLGLGDI